MKSPIFDEVIEICRSIAMSSQEQKETEREQAYQELIKLCAKHENTPRDHPFQWEALAEFTLDADQAIDLYEKGVVTAQKMSLVDAQASIYLAMINRYLETEQLDKAKVNLALVQAIQGDIENKNIVDEITDVSVKLGTLP